MHLLGCLLDLFDLFVSTGPVEANGGRMSPLTMKLARLGTSVKHPANIERDLHHALQLPVPVYWVDIPVRSDVDRKTVEVASLSEQQ